MLYIVKHLLYSRMKTAVTGVVVFFFRPESFCLLSDVVQQKDITNLPSPTPQSHESILVRLLGRTRLHS